MLIGYVRMTAHHLAGSRTVGRCLTSSVTQGADNAGFRESVSKLIDPKSNASA